MKKLKRIFAVVLATLMVTMLVGCGDSSSENYSSSGDDEENKIYSLGSTYILDGDEFELQVNDKVTLCYPTSRDDLTFTYSWEVTSGNSSIVILSGSGDTCSLTATDVGTVEITVIRKYDAGALDFNEEQTFTVSISERSGSGTKNCGKTTADMCTECYGSGFTTDSSGSVKVCSECGGSGRVD